MRPVASQKEQRMVLSGDQMLSQDNLDNILIDLIGPDLVELSAKLHGEHNGKTVAISVMK